MSMESKARKEDMSIQAKVAKDPAMSVEAKTSKEEMSAPAVEAKAFKQDMSVGKADKDLSVAGKASKVMSV
jgi:hypothetical protein